MSCGHVKNSLIVYFSLTRASYLVTGQVKILMYLPGGQVKILNFFTPDMGVVTIHTISTSSSAILCPIIMTQSYFEKIKKYRTDDNSLLSVSSLHVPAVYETKIIVISSLVCQISIIILYHFQLRQWNNAILLKAQRKTMRHNDTIFHYMH